MDKIFRNCFFILAGILTFTLVSCAHQTAKTGFLKDYSKLEAHPDIDGRFRYINSNIDASKYSKFIV